MIIQLEARMMAVTMIVMAMLTLVIVRMGCCTCHGDSDGLLDKTSDAFFFIVSVYWSPIYMNYRSTYALSLSQSKAL